MPGFGDYFFIFVLALILFGPKKLPELARQLGKLMGEFRRASNEFKMQMEEEMRVSERAEQEQKIAALEAASPTPAGLPASVSEPADPTYVDPYTDANVSSVPAEITVPYEEAEATVPPETPAIATAGELTMRPPETGLPVARESAKADAASSDAVNALADSVPAAEEGQTTHG
ncbi:MAG TPA: twin-arginine translocase TatA/TatE family subunit [Acidobacteriaceae bacterium]